MEDVKIARNTRFQTVLTNRAFPSTPRLKIPGNPSRMSLIICVTSAYGGHFTLHSRPTGLDNIFWEGNSGFQYDVFETGSVGADGLTTDAFVPLFDRCKLDIIDYGQLIMGDCWLSADTAGIEGTIIETYLLANESSDL